MFVESKRLCACRRTLDDNSPFGHSERRWMRIVSKKMVIVEETALLESCKQRCVYTETVSQGTTG
jgi:hypothetical protein